MPDRPPVVVPVSVCLGIQPGRGMVALVFQRPDGALHVVEMPEPTALAVDLAIRTRLQAPPLGDRAAAASSPMAAADRSPQHDEAPR